MHKSMCDACNAYEKAQGKIDDLLHKHIHDDSFENKAVLEQWDTKRKDYYNIPNNWNDCMSS